MSTVVPLKSPSAAPPTILYVSGPLEDPVGRALFTRELQRELALARAEGRLEALQRTLDTLMAHLSSPLARPDRMLVARAGEPVHDVGEAPARSRARLIVHTEAPPWIAQLFEADSAA